MGLFCKHDWKVLDKTVLPSPYQQFQQERKRNLVEMEASASFFRTKVLVIVVCSICGKKAEHFATNPL